MGRPEGNHRMRHRDFPLDHHEGIILEPTHDQQVAVVSTLMRYNALDVAAMILAPLNPVRNRNRKW
jgi:hypothetical protein